MVFSFIQVPFSIGLGFLSSTLSCMQHHSSKQLGNHELLPCSGLVVFLALVTAMPN